MNGKCYIIYFILNWECWKSSGDIFPKINLEMVLQNLGCWQIIFLPHFKTSGNSLKTKALEGILLIKNLVATSRNWNYLNFEIAPKLMKNLNFSLIPRFVAIRLTIFSGNHLGPLVNGVIGKHNTDFCHRKMRQICFLSG